MARTATPGRLEHIGDAALTAFSELGFRRAQMSDIARISAVAQGTLYLYVKSKEALFWLALQRAMGEELVTEPVEGELLAHVQQKLTLSLSMPLLWGATATNVPPLMPTLGEIWDSIERYASAIRLVERCAQDWPELAAMFYSELRPTLLRKITAYLEAGAEQGVLRRVSDPALAARVVIEAMAWFAIHRHGDADGRYYDPAAAKAATLDALFHAYIAR
jgi:AcrR family transcriptional regulator